MLKVGITGGIGSGKTYICNMFKAFDVPIYNADERAKTLMVTNISIREQIIDLLGKKAYSGEIPNKKYIANKAFKNQELLHSLNNIIHPVVSEDSLNWFKQHSNQSYVLKEAAILFETKTYKNLDKTILVIADKDLRILRVMQRDGVSKEKVLERIKNQMSDLDKMELADFILNNNDNKDIEKVVEKLHTYFTSIQKAC